MSELLKKWLGTAVAKVASLWNRCWFATFDPICTAWFRINLGLLMVFTFLFNSSNWNRFYHTTGVGSWDVPEVLSRQAVPETWTLFAWLSPTADIGWVWWLGLLASVCFTLGFLGRLSTVVCYIVISSMINRVRQLTNGDDLMFRMLLFHAIWMPTHHTLSVDAWLRGRLGWKQPEAPWVWSTRFLQINVLLVYIISLPNKFAQDLAWEQGQAIYYTMASDMWYRGFFPELAYRWGPWFSYCATYGTALIEGSFPIIVWFRRTRPLGLFLVTALHLGIAVIVPGVTFFTLSMIAGFWAFYDADTLHRWGNKIRALATRSALKAPV